MGSQELADPIHPDDNILCTLPFPEPTAALDRIRSKHPNVKITWHQVGASSFRTTEAEDESIYADCTILLTIARLPPSREAAPLLRLVHFCSAGTNHMASHPMYNDHELTMTTSSGTSAPQIAEWVVMMLLTHGHRYDELKELRQRREWPEKAPAGVWKTRDMVGQRVGILGYGSIGRQVGRVVKAMGSHVYAFTASPRDTAESKRDDGHIIGGTGDPYGSVPEKWFSGLNKEAVHDFLSQDLDVLVICIPLTPSTKHLLSSAEFDLLARKHALLINVARGGVIDQPALIAALKSGQLRAAALDVADPEPLPADDPLWQAPNLTMTPHVSGIVFNYVERAIGVLEENLDRRARGEAFVNVVDRSKGY